MSTPSRLRFFLTLFSAYLPTRRKSHDAIIPWLNRVKEFGFDESPWREVSEQLKASIGAALSPETASLIEDQVIKMVKLKIDISTRLEADYPASLHAHLGDKAPLFFWFRGNRQLLTRKAVGFCGSRNATSLGLEVCEDIVGQLVKEDVVIVAGYAKGVDQTAHLVALRDGGATVAVLAEGILNFSVRKLIGTDWNWERSLVVSEFLPQKRWGIPNAMQRNRTIIGLGGALVVIEAGETGGTFEAGKEALAISHPLFAPIYGSVEANISGNKILIGHGAVPILKSRSSGRANIGPVLAALESSR